jgi:hypothetical protein
LAVFPDLNGPLTEAQKTRIYQAFKRGASGRQADQAVRPHKTTIYRVINEVRATARIMEMPLDFIPNAGLLRKGADNAILGPMLNSIHRPRRRAASWPAAVFGELVRDAAAQSRAGSPLVPQV